MGSAGQTNYAAAKGALVAFTKSLATEVGPYGVTVNCVAPGFVETEMISFLTKEAREDFTKRIPLRRFGVPEDVAPLVAFLCTRRGRLPERPDDPRRRRLRRLNPVLVRRVPRLVYSVPIARKEAEWSKLKS